MFLDFFLLLRQHALPVTLPEYLTLLEALKSDAGGVSVDAFYYLSKTTLIKHEQHLDLFDRLFGEYIAGIPSKPVPGLTEVPPDWLENALLNDLSEEEKAAILAMGGLDALWDRLRVLLEQQEKRHEGGSRWIGTGGTSPFGAMGYNPEGFRMSGEAKGNHIAVKIWEQRDYRNLDDDLELNTRNMKMALRRLRILTREGQDDELDIDGTIEETSRNGGLLDIQMQPSRQNRVKVLMLLDVGGSMDEYIDLCSQLFSAARYQFKRLEFFYFHNCVYETLWRDNTRRHDRVPTWEVLHKYNKEYKVIFVGDASMAPYEITTAKGSIEHYNEEAGIVWLNRFKQQYPHLVWLNPTVPGYWKYTSSTGLIRDWCDERMFPLTLNGLTQAMKCLKNPKVRYSAD
ncbi:VWA domain-containing protein [Nibrella saemangeumensis]|uniref:VWA domain-containing protein n=1 Tax=Nibrella saemangeumensis TaxID=1084526 RepID=A0ABP8MGJ8_9BACT